MTVLRDPKSTPACDGASLALCVSRAETAAEQLTDDTHVGQREMRGLCKQQEKLNVHTTSGRRRSAAAWLTEANAKSGRSSGDGSQRCQKVVVVARRAEKVSIELAGRKKKKKKVRT